MTRRWMIGLFSLMLMVVVGWSSHPAQATMPLPASPTGLGLPPLPPVVALAPRQALEAGPTDFTLPALPDATLLAQATPRQVVTLADPSNYGDRFATDANGQPLAQDFIAVLHETVGSAQSAINLFRTYHARDADQVSYHALIGRDGTIYYIVPPEKRAFGAGNSVFDGPNGPETARTNPNFPPSVNNFAYHVSLETPGDGMNNRRSHSGYTQAQYTSLAWLLAQTTIPESRITTHQAVDRAGNRMDPRSFNRQQLLTLLRQYPSRASLPA
ncbi:MAG: peptidoglycan recognition family protein [Leptolyngbya sp.]|nr:peptidoglycan recognition family protein [Leptolyngbya sp.]